MATEINDIRDLVRIVEEHPEWRGELQRVLLTQALLDLPDTMVKRFDDLDENVGRIHTSHREEHQAMHRFRGNYAANAATKNIRSIAARFAALHGFSIVVTRIITEEELDRMATQNIDRIQALVDEGELQLGEDVFNRFASCDAIAKVGNRRYGEDPDTEYYIAVETSYTGNTADLERVTDYVKVIHAITGLTAYPVVAGARIDGNIVGKVFDSVERYVESEASDVAVWHQLDVEEMEPPSPR